MAQNINIVIDQGTTFNAAFNIVDLNGEPLDLSSYTSNSEFKKTYMSTNAHVFTTAVDANGVVYLSMNAVTTSSAWPGRYVYDVRVTDVNGNVSRLIQGLVTVTPSVT